MPQALFKQSSSLPDLVVDVSLPGTSRASPVVQLAKGVDSSNDEGSTQQPHTQLRDIASYLDTQLQQLDRLHH